MTLEIQELVRRRAGNRCEYCQLPQEHHQWKLEIEHVVSKQHGGDDDPANLALSCPKCNRHKGPNVAGLDPQTRTVTPLFDPRTNSWGEHVEWSGPMIVAKTAVARATLVTLNLNDPVRVAARQALIELGVFPLT